MIHLLTPQKFRAGMKESAVLLRFKWHSVRSKRTRNLIYIGLVCFLISILAVSNTGYFIRALAQGIIGTDSLIQQISATYLLTFSEGKLGTLGATVLGGAVISSIIAPFTGAVSTSLVPHSNLVSIRASNHHRFTDSIITQLISSVSLLQILALTTITSLLTIEGGRSWGLVFTWSLLPVFVMMSVLSLWIAEYLHRVVGGRIRLVVIISVLSILGLAVLLDPNHGKTVFGLGVIFAQIVQNIGNYTMFAKILTFTVVIISVISLILISGTIASKTLSHPERNTSDTDNKRKKKPRKLSIYPEIEFFHILFAQLWRNMETRRPLLAAMFIGTILAVVTSGNFAIQTTFTVMVPVVVALAWGVNVFGIIGPGMTWLASQPHIMKWAPSVIGAVQLSATLGMFVIIWFPAVILNKVSFHEIIIISFAAISTSILITRSSLNKSIKKPYPTHAGTRGEGIVPPIITLTYTLRMALWGGQCGVIILAIDNILVGASMCFLAIFWSVIRYSMLLNSWSKNSVKAHIISIVTR